MKKFKFQSGIGLGFIYLFCLNICLLLAGVVMHSIGFVIAAIILGMFQLFLHYQFRVKYSALSANRYAIDLKNGLTFFYSKVSGLNKNDVGHSFNRKQREVIIKRSGNIPTGIIRSTLTNPNSAEFECIRKDKTPIKIECKNLQVDIGTEQCIKPYNLSVLNVGALNQQSLSSDAIHALSEGAKIQGCAVNTGECGISPYLIRGGGDLIWQISNDNVAFRNADGSFNETLFKRDATRPYVKMIEVILSGQDISTIRKDFSADKAILFLKRLRDLSKGKPIGIKLYTPDEELISCIATSMVNTGIYIDFITIDGIEPGKEVLYSKSNSPFMSQFFDSLAFARKAADRNKLPVKIIASGKIVTEYDILRAIALGAHACYCTGPMIYATGTGSSWFKKPDPLTQRVGVANFHRNTVNATIKLMELCSYETLDDVKASDFYRRSNFLKTRNLKEIYFENSVSQMTLLGN